MNGLLKNPARRQRGTATVETVVAAPVLLLLLVATAEISSAFINHNVLTKATRNGARFVAANSLQGTTGTVSLSPTVIVQARNLVVFGNPAGTGTPLLPGLATGNVQVTLLPDDNIQVSATYAHNGILGNTLPGFGYGGDANLGMTLSATTAMRPL